MRNLDFSISGGKAFLKIDARSGTFKVSGGEDDDVTLINPTFEVDPESIDTGWLAFVKGEGTQFVSGTSLANKPASAGGIEFKQGVRFNVFGTEAVPELGEPLGLREIASTAFVTRRATAAMYKLIARDIDNHAGQVPVVRCSRFVSVKMKNGSAHEPVFEIIGWAPRREEFGPAEEEGPDVTAVQPQLSPPDDDIPDNWQAPINPRPSV